jgi:branched-subunit amino acid aminotransferase/4-amino-4-deoxychorismate lyase
MPNAAERFQPVGTRYDDPDDGERSEGSRGQPAEPHRDGLDLIGPADVHVFDADLDPEHVRHLVRRALIDVPMPVIARVTAFDPSLELGHPGADAHPSVLVTTRRAVDVPQPAIRLRSVRYDRDMPEVKHVGLFGALRCRRVAQRDGFDDAVFTDAASNITEVATSNVGFFDGDRVIWPDAAVLPGVTMALLNNAHDGPLTTASVNLVDLDGMQAAFATNSAVGVRPIASIDHTVWTHENAMLGILRKEYLDNPPEPI